MTATWPAPTPAPTSTPSPARRRNVGLLVLLAVAVLPIGLFGIGMVGGADDPATTTSTTSGSFYASAGWTAQRAADLSVKMQRDGGISRDRAQCAMRAIVGRVTWLEWQSLGNGGQFSAIRTAADGCLTPTR